jgi:hypothetical protein
MRAMLAWGGRVLVRWIREAGPHACDAPAGTAHHERKRRDDRNERMETANHEWTLAAPIEVTTPNEHGDENGRGCGLATTRRIPRPPQTSTGAFSATAHCVIRLVGETYRAAFHDGKVKQFFALASHAPELPDGREESGLDLPMMGTSRYRVRINRGLCDGEPCISPPPSREQ